MISSSIPVLLSVAYNPPIAWFALLAKHEVLLEAHETYPKQTYRNRCVIYSEKGSMALSIPVLKLNGNHTNIKEVKIFNEERWYLRHWRALQSAYEAAPYYLYYKDDLEDFYSGKYESLFEFNLKLTQLIALLLDIRFKMVLTDSFQKNPDNCMDWREMIHPKRPLNNIEFPPYIQVFSDRHGFIPNLSILDLLFNLGPESKTYLRKIILP